MAQPIVGADGKYVSYDGGNSWVPNPGLSRPVAPTAAPAPQVQSQPYQAQAPAPVVSEPYRAPQSGNVDLSVYGITNPNYITPQQLDILGQDYDNLEPITTSGGGVISILGYRGYKIPKAVVISPNGQRVTVRTDNRTGKFRTLNEMTAQGFVPEKAPGIAQNNTQVSGDGFVDLSNKPNIRLSNGQIISNTDSNYSLYAQTPGATPITQPSAPAAGGSSITVGSVPGSSSQGGSSGVDTSGWTGAMQEAYGALESYVTKLTSQGKILNPDIRIDDATIARFTEQAKTEMEPYYKQVFDQVKQDLDTAISRAKEDYTSREREISLNYGQNLENTQESFARRGREFSSDRTKAEQNVRDQAQTQLDAAQRATGRNLFDFATTAERKLGSANLPSLNTNLSAASVPTSSRPGIYGLDQNTRQIRNLFSPVGGVTGDIERQKLFDVESRKNSLVANERELRASNYM